MAREEQEASERTDRASIPVEEMRAENKELREKLDRFREGIEHRMERLEDSIDRAFADEAEEREAFQASVQEELGGMREALEGIETTETQSRTFTGATLVFAVIALSAILIFLYFIFQMIANVV